MLYVGEGSRLKPLLRANAVLLQFFQFAVVGAEVKRVEVFAFEHAFALVRMGAVFAGPDMAFLVQVRGFVVVLFGVARDEWQGVRKRCGNVLRQAQDERDFWFK